MQALIPQLATLLKPPEVSADLAPPPDRRMQIAALAAMQDVIRICAVRMFRWKEDVLEGVCMCWVSIVDSGANDEGKPISLNHMISV